MRRLVTAVLSAGCAVSVALGLGAPIACATPPTPQWASAFGTAGADLWPIGVSAFPDGSSVAGFSHSTGSVSIAGTAITGGTAIAKLSATGTVGWVTQIAGPAANGETLASAPGGATIVAGYINGAENVGGTPLSSNGGLDVFVAKIDANGAWAWARNAGGSDHDRAYAAKTLSDGSVVVAGFFRGTATFGSTTLVSAGLNDVFVAKLSADGNWLWATRAGGTSNESATDLAVNASGEIAITGVFDGTTGAGTAPTFGSTTLSSLGAGDIYVATLTPSGAWNWAVSAGSTGNDGYGQGKAVAMQADGSVFLAGAFAGSMTLGSLPTLTRVGNDDLFAAKLTAAGVWAWSVAAGGTTTDQATGVAALTDGSAVVLASYGNTSLTLGSTTLTRAGGNTGLNLAVARITSGGAWDWATSIASGGSMPLAPNGMAVLANGSVLINGEYSSNAPPQTITLGGTVLTFTGAAADYSGFVTCLGSVAADCQGIAGAPDAPQSVSASIPADGTSVTAVSFSAPSANGSPILSYAATCTSSNGGAAATASGTASPLSVADLTPGATYTCTVTATNALGTSAASAASAPITCPSTAASSSSASTASASSVTRTTGTTDTAAQPTLRVSQVESTPQGAVVIFTAPEAGRATLVGTVARGSHASPERACATAKRVRRAGPVKLVCTLRSNLRATSAGAKLTLVTTFRPKSGTASSSSRTITLRDYSSTTAPPPTG